MFAYFSIDKVITDWRSANQEEFLSRYPDSFLLSIEQKDAILKNIDLSSIPRYVLINKAGVIVNADADRPGNVKIREAI